MGTDQSQQMTADAVVVDSMALGLSAKQYLSLTARARSVLAFAREEGASLLHNYIGTEHLLLGLVCEQEGVAGRVLAELGVELVAVRESVESIIGRGDREVKGDVGLTPRAKKVMELSVKEARRLGHAHVGTEHILLGLIREGEGIAAGILESLGLKLNEVRYRVILLLGAVNKDNVVTCRLVDEDVRAIDSLVETGIRATRSDAAAWLIHEGIEANKDLFDKVSSTVGQIRKLRDEARAIAEQHGAVLLRDRADGAPAEAPGDATASTSEP